MLPDIKNRRMSVFGLLAPSGAIFWKKLPFLAAICLFVYTPIEIIFELFPAQIVLTQQDILNQDIDKIFLSAYANLAVLTIFAPLATAAVACVCQRSAEGQKVSFAAILDNSLLKWPRILLSSLLFLAVIMLSSVLIVLPVYFAVSFAFYVHVAAVSDKWGPAALAESRNMVRGRWWATAGSLILINIMETAVSMGIGSLLLIWASGMGAAASLAVRIVMNVIGSYFQVLLSLYFLNGYYLYMGGQMDDAGAD